MRQRSAHELGVGHDGDDAGAREVGVREVGAHQDGREQTRVAQVGVAQVDAVHDGDIEGRPGEDRLARHGVRQRDGEHLGFGEVGAHAAAAGQVGPLEVYPRQIEPGEVLARQVRGVLRGGRGEGREHLLASKPLPLGPLCRGVGSRRVGGREAPRHRQCRLRQQVDDVTLDLELVAIADPPRRHVHHRPVQEPDQVGEPADAPSHDPVHAQGPAQGHGAGEVAAVAGSEPAGGERGCDPGLRGRDVASARHEVGGEPAFRRVAARAQRGAHAVRIGVGACVYRDELDHCDGSARRPVLGRARRGCEGAQGRQGQGDIPRAVCHWVFLRSDSRWGRPGLSQPSLRAFA